MKSAADGKVELSYSYAIDGRGIWNHKDALSAEQELAVKAAQYAHHTLAKESQITYLEWAKNRTFLFYLTNKSKTMILTNKGKS